MIIQPRFEWQAMNLDTKLFLEDKTNDYKFSRGPIQIRHAAIFLQNYYVCGQNLIL